MSSKTTQRNLGAQYVGAIAHHFDGWILDQWGVLHNGVNSLPGAVHCVEQLHRAGKKLVILSNSSLRADATLQNLSRIGFEPTL